MRIFNKDDSKALDITFHGVEYSFLVDKQGIGIRRKDNKKPTVTEVRKITEYVFAEGWAEKGDYEQDKKTFLN